MLRAFVVISALLVGAGPSLAEAQRSVLNDERLAPVRARLTASIDVGQTDDSYGGEISGGWLSEMLAVELGLSVLRRESSEKGAERTEFSPWLGVSVTTKHVGGRVLYRYVAREFEMGSRNGAEHLARIELWGMPLTWIGGYVTAEIGYADGGPQALSYERVQVTGGIRLFANWQPEPSDDDEGSKRAVSILEDGAVRFTYERPDAEQISVVGDFNGWDEERGRLERTDGGRFAGSFSIAPGRYEYHLLVDGTPERPPDAARYVQDGFGGENAILVVGENP